MNKPVILLHNVYRYSSVCILAILLNLLIGNSPSHASNPIERRSEVSKEDKLVYVTAGSMVFITVWGIHSWGYGEESLHARSEDWFSENTEYGGADKTGHFYSGYVINHALTSLYHSWGYQKNKAIKYGAWSSFGLLSFLEITDATSSIYSFSYEDFIMNGLGSYTGYLLNRSPDLASKIDIRIEYQPSDDNGIDIITDYEHSKYLLALKMSGFSSIRHSLLQYLELHAGYYTRGYLDNTVEKERNLFIGVGVNLARLFEKKSYHRTSTFLRYYQIPYTDIQHKYPL